MSTPFLTEEDIRVRKEMEQTKINFGLSRREKSKSLSYVVHGSNSIESALTLAQLEEYWIGSFADVDMSAITSAMKADAYLSFMEEVCNGLQTLEKYIKYLHETYALTREIQHKQPNISQYLLRDNAPINEVRDSLGRINTTLQDLYTLRDSLIAEILKRKMEVNLLNSLSTTLKTFYGRYEFAEAFKTLTERDKFFAPPLAQITKIQVDLKNQIEALNHGYDSITSKVYTMARVDESIKLILKQEGHDRFLMVQDSKHVTDAGHNQELLEHTPETPLYVPQQAKTPTPAQVQEPIPATAPIQEFNPFDQAQRNEN